MMAIASLGIRIAIMGSALAVFGVAQTAIDDSTAFGYYRLLFRHVTFLKARADEKIAKGQRQTQLAQTYKIAANLTDSEAASLESVSLACAAKLNNIAGQAGQVIAAAHAAPQRPKAGSPAEAALAALHQQEVQTVLTHRDSLRRQLGDLRFAKFETFLRGWMSVSHSSIQAIQPRPPQSAAGIYPNGAAK